MQTFTIDDVSEYIKICPKDELYRIRRESQARITANNQGGKVAKVPEQWSLDIAFKLAELAKANFPFVKPTSLTDWAADIEKIHTIDKQPVELINGIAQWSQTDDFWKKQIRSGAALRRHFEKLYIAGKSAYDKQQKGRVHVI